MRQNRSIRFLAPAALLAGAALAAGEVPLSPNVRSLVDAERAFCKASIAKGTKDAFLGALAADSVLFRPRPVAGRKWTVDHPATPGLLTWEPAYAEASKAGDLGFTTGPWEFREKTMADKPIGYGQYLSVWQKQTDGTWKVALDCGVSNPPPAGPAPALQAHADSPAAGKVDGGEAALTALESEFSTAASASQGAAAAYLAHAADDIRLFRPGAFPAVGKEAARSALASRPGPMAWEIAKVVVSRSGDFGYTFGAYRFPGPDGKPIEAGNVVRVWRKGADWRWILVADLLNPVPAPGAAPPPSKPK